MLRKHLQQDATYGVVTAGRFLRSGVPMLRGGDIKDGKVGEDQPLISEEKSREYSRTILRDGDVVIALVGYPGESAVVPERLIGANISRAVGLLRPAKDLLPSYLACYLNSPSGRKEFLRPSAGSAQVVVNLGALNKLEIPVPRPEEQSAIATALSDVDALLAAQDAVIAKKRAIKQGAMQELLTGKRRLPGFSGEWAVRSLSELGHTYGGLAGKSKNDFGHGDALYVPFVNVMANVIIDSTAFDKVAVSSGETQNRVLKGDLLFNGSSETPEEVAMCALVAEHVANLFLNSFCFGYRLKETAQTNRLFLAYYMRGQVGRDLIKSLAQGSTRYNLSKSAFLEGQLKLPDEKEQSAIAEVLSDIDAEITALEVQRAKVAQLKQGLMQELLTGRIRLIGQGRQGESAV